jgi:PKD repeat protein
MSGVFSLGRKLTSKSLCAFVFMISAVVGQENYSTSWTYHQKIYINTTSFSLTGNITNFPLLIRVTPTSMNGYSSVKAKGADIRFSKSNNSTPLSYEIEKWDSTSGVIWVNVDTVFSNNISQYIVMHYGNALAVDSSKGTKVFQTSNRFTGVWHINDNFNDVTSNANNGTNNATTDVAGIAASGKSFNGTTSTITLTNPLTTTLGTGWPTLSFWQKSPVMTNGGRGWDCAAFIGNDQASNIGDIWYGVTDSNKIGVKAGNGAAVMSKTSLNDTTWHYIAMTRRASDGAISIFIDGKLDTSGTSDVGNKTGDTLKTFGKNMDGKYITGAFDEIRVEDTARSADWILLSYGTQKPNQVTVCFKPTIITQPHDTLVNPGDTAAFFIGARGDSLKYKWQKSTDGTTWKDTGSTGTSYKFKTSLTTDTTIRYRCIVSSLSYSDTSTVAVVKMLPCVPARISTQPADNAVIEGKAARFAARGTGSSISYQWQRKSGTTWSSIPGAIDTVCFITASGTDNGAIFRCFVSSLCGQDSSQEVTLTVYTKARASFKMSDTIGTAPYTVTLTDSSGGNISKWHWYFGDGKDSVCLTSANQVHVFDSAGTYTVKLVVEGTGGTDSISRKLTVYSRPRAFFKMADTSGIAPFTETLTDSSSGSISKWRWYFGDGKDSICSTSAKQVHTYDSAGVYTVKLVVTGPGGGTDSLLRKLTIYSKAHASFKMSDSIGPAPLSVTFTDSSSGSISKWRWYFGDGKDSVCSVSSKLVHIFDSAKTYQVKLVVEGPGGIDSTFSSIKVYPKGGNPIVLTGRYIAPDNVELLLKNYAGLQTALPAPFASSVKLWIKGGALPLDTAGCKLQKTYDISSLKARGTDYLDTVKVSPLTLPDSTYGFATQVVWNDGSTTPFTTTNGFLVLMRDTVKPVNILRLSALYTPRDTVTFNLDSIQKIDTAKVDSVGLWYGLGNDTIPNFVSNTAAVKWWAARDVVKGASGNRFKYQLKSDQFNTTVKTLTCAVILVSKSRIRSTSIKTNILIGLSLNPIHLRATAISSSSIRLTWNRPVEQDSVERIRIYYSNRDTLPFNCDFSAIKVDSVVPEPTLMDTTVLVSNLKEKTWYHFGACVYKKGVWSSLTNLSVANDSTLDTNASVIANTVILNKLVYDTTPNNLQIFLNDSLVDSGCQLGVTFAFIPGITPPDTSFKKIMSLDSISDSAVVALDSSIPLDQDLDVFLWLRKIGGKWAAPTPQSTGRIHIPPFTSQKVHYNFSLKGDTTSWANGQIRFITPPVGQIAIMNYSGVIRPFIIDPAKSSGFISVGSSFVFSEKDVAPAFSIYIKCKGIPAKYSLKDVRIYRFDGTRWVVDRSTEPGTDSLSVGVKAYSLDMPFAAMIDTLPPKITVLSKGSRIVEKGVTVFDTVYVSDNTGNVLWNYRCAKGEQPFPSGVQTQIKTLTTGSDTAIIFIQKDLVAEDNGVRAHLVADDGHSTSMVDLSRQVIREKSDPTVMESMKWTPLRVTATLDTPSAIRLLNFLNPPDSNMGSYDNTLIRLFRWYPGASNAGSANKWVEYSNDLNNIFELKSGRLLWVKTRNAVLFDFGRAVTMSLTDTVDIPLNNKGWTDFATPFMFNIRVGDILSATRKGTEFTDSLQIYKWIKDTSGTYHCEPFFMATRSDNGLDSLSKVLSIYDAGFSVYNPCDAPVTLRVPPIPEALSPAAGYVAKRAAAEGWVLRVIPRGENGAELSSVYCGYTPALTGMHYYPLPPRLGGPEVGVVEEQSGQLSGSMIFHDVKSSGCTYLLSLRNEDKSVQTIQLELAQWGNLPSGMKTAFYNPLNGQVTDVSAKEAFAVKVEGQAQEYVMLLVGDDNYIASGLKKFSEVKLALKNVYPNPLRGAMHLQYMVPFARVGKVKFKILDLMGKTVWQTTIKEHTISGGVRSVTWNGTTKTGMQITSGFYLVNMTAYDFNSRAIGSFNRRITVLR